MLPSLFRLAACTSPPVPTRTSSSRGFVPVAARCPSCGGALSETSVLAIAPVCRRCGSVLTIVGGSLGLTSAYGVNDPSITRRRVEADLTVFREYQSKYTAMLEACKQQLEWRTERYATLPLPPELLKLEDVPSFSNGVVVGVTIAFIPLSISSFFLYNLYTYPIFMGRPLSMDFRVSTMFNSIVLLFLISGGIGVYLFWKAGVSDHFRIKAANGSRPLENAQMQKAYEEAVAAALKAAEPIKAAEDHRLRYQIRELEGLAKTVAEKEADVRRILATL